MSEYLQVAFHENDCLFVKSLGYENNPAFAHWGPGYRDYCILHYVISGSGFFNGKKVSENQGFFISNNLLHEYHSDTENPWNYVWIIFSEEIARKYVLPIVRLDCDNIFQFHFKGKLMKMFQNVFDEYTFLSHVQALEIFFRLISLHETSIESQPRISAQYVWKAKSYIENNFNKNITVSDVAKEVYVNERYLYNLFMRYENISVKEYINLQRYTQACELLTNTYLSVSEIAWSVGYNDVLAFSKFFSKKAGVSPSKYRGLFNER